MLANRFTKSPARLSLLLLPLLLSSCGRVRVISPLSDPEKAKPDERLCGMWKPEKKDDEASEIAFLFIGKVGLQNSPAGIMKAMAMELDKNNNIRDLSLYFFTTSAADERYANLFGEDVVNPDKSPVWNKKNMRSFLLYKYKIEDHKLTIWHIDDDAVEVAVRKGQVKGKIEEGNTTTVTLTDGEDLLRYLKAGGDKKLFEDKHKQVFVRVK